MVNEITLPVKESNIVCVNKYPGERDRLYNAQDTARKTLKLPREAWTFRQRACVSDFVVYGTSVTI